MNRRKYLLSVGAVGFTTIAGCTDDDENESTPTETQDTGEDDRSTTQESETDTQETVTDEDPSNTQEAEENEEADVVFGNKELLHRETNGTTITVGRVEVENRGDRHSGPITIEVQWFDAEDNYLGDTTRRLHTLKSGEVWAPEISDSTIEGDRIDYFEYSGEVDSPPRPAPEGTAVSQSELVIQQYRTEIRGTVENTRDEDLSYIVAIGRVLNKQGQVLGDSTTTESDIPAGSGWRFDIRLGSIEADTRVSQDTNREEIEHEVILSSGVFR